MPFEEGHQYARKLLIAVDASPESEKAFTWAFNQLYREGDEVHIMHVVPSTSYDMLTADPEATFTIENPEKQKEIQDAAMKYLVDTYEQGLKEQNVNYKLDVIKYMTDCDSVGRAICDRAEELNVYAVVLASHHKSAIKEFFLGSVTKYCTHNCKRPLVILH